MTNPPRPPHSRATRLAHAGLALAVGVDLLTSIILQAPGQKLPANVYFKIHQDAGLLAGALALALWAIILVRQVGTPVGLLLPWFSRRRPDAFWGDLTAHLADLRTHRLPPYQEAAPFATAIHGLGLLLITAMAVTGTIYALALRAALPISQAAILSMGLHRILGDLTWVFLAGHGLLSLVHHYGLDKSLAEMWSLERHGIEKD